MAKKAVKKATKVAAKDSSPKSAGGKLGKTKNGKFDMAGLIKATQAKMGRNKKLIDSIGTGKKLSHQVGVFDAWLHLPMWFKKQFGIPGLELGTLNQIAGPSDSGKTSFVLEAMREAQKQGFIVVLGETEGKTSSEKIADAGIDEDQILLTQNKIVEYCWQGVLDSWDAVYDAYPDTPVFLVIDSIGNTVSDRDKEIDLTKEHSKVGGSAKTNSLAISKFLSTLISENRKVVALIVNRNYANIGSHGNTIAGGQGLYFHSKLIIESNKGAVIMRTVKGTQYEVGRKIYYKNRKNHHTDGLKDENGDPVYPIPKVTYEVTADGIKREDGDFDYMSDEYYAKFGDADEAAPPESGPEEDDQEEVS